MAPERKRASAFETVGAWLRVWTPPRDVDVPPIPWRALGPLALLLAALVFFAVRSGDEPPPSQERALQAAERRAKQRAEQRPQRARMEPGPRAGMVAALEAGVLRDALERAREGRLRQRPLRVECEPHPRTSVRLALEDDPSASSGRYHCLAVTSDIRGVGSGTLGYPFIAKIAYRTGALVWCKVTPVPGEQHIPDARTVVQLPRVCL